MRASQSLTFLLLACFLFNTEASFAAFPGSLSFTSGLPPRGDGETYPRSLNPARQANGGASPGSFFTTLGVDFNNLNGNPAYFDDNNLLTRPATLINNDAFWTDPKLGQFSSGGGGTFELAQFGFSFLPGISDGADFGFDLAMASVSSDLPVGNFYDDLTGDFITAPFLPFQIQDDNFNTAQGSLVFATGESSSPDQGGAVFAQSVGTFNTLNSPRTAYEARFRLDQFFLQSLIEYESDIFGGDPGDDPDGEFGDGDFNSTPIQFFDIDLESIATFGGTTQVAMDNFVLAGSPPINDPLREPLNFSPFDPVGANTPQYFVTDDSGGDPFEGITDGVFEALDIATSAADGEFDVSILGNPTPTGTQTTGVITTVPSDSELRTDIDDPMAGVVVEYDEPVNPNTFVPENEIPLGGVVNVNTVNSNGEETTGQFIVEAINETSNTLSETTSQISNAIQSTANQILQDSGVDLGSTDPDAALPLTDEQLRSLLESSFLEAEAFLQPSSSNQSVGDLIQSIGAQAFTDGSLFGEEGIEGLSDGIIGSDVPSSINEIGNAVSMFSEEVSHAILNVASQELSEQGQSIIESGDSIQDAARQAILRIRTTANNLQPITVGDFIAEVEAIVAAGSTFVNYSYAQYQQYLADNGLSPTIGDTGGYTEPIFNSAGEVIDFRFNSWIVTDQSGGFIASLTFASEVPEPSSALILASLLGFTAMKKRSK